MSAIPIQIRFVGADGRAQELDARAGDSVMRLAVQAGVLGILAECGGACACATCHVRIGPEWSERLPPPSEMEAEMLTYAVASGETSRLACQIVIGPDLDGMVVFVPATQK